MVCEILTVRGACRMGGLRFFSRSDNSVRPPGLPIR